MLHSQLNYHVQPDTPFQDLRVLLLLTVHTTHEIRGYLLLRQQPLETRCINVFMFKIRYKELTIIVSCSYIRYQRSYVTYHIFLNLYISFLKLYMYQDVGRIYICNKCCSKPHIYKPEHTQIYYIVHCSLTTLVLFVSIH